MRIIRRLLLKRMKVAPSLNSVCFRATGFSPQGEIEGARVWLSTEGDGIGLYFFPVRPDLPANAKSPGELRDRMAAVHGSETSALVQISLPQIDDCYTVQQIVKVPQEPHGLTYIGAIIIPFQEFSFVVKIQCHEHGMTGMREAALMAEGLSNGTMKVIERENEDPTIAGEWNPDDERYDSRFPDHPLSRVRRILTDVTASLQIDAAVKLRPRFPLPVDDSR